MGDPVYIRIFKEERVLELWMKRQSDHSYWIYETYPICNYSGLLGPKFKEGDKQAPEGFYAVTPRQMNYNSQYYLAFNLGYPNAYDRQHNYTGSHLMVHGDCKSVGCYAMTNAKIMEIYGLMEAAMKQGQNYVPVHIFPFRMTSARMAGVAGAHAPFWQNLKEGYDRFSLTGLPPKAYACNGVYHFDAEGEGCEPIAGN